MSNIRAVSGEVEPQKITQVQKYVSWGVGCTVGAVGLFTTVISALFAGVIAGMAHDSPSPKASFALVKAMPGILFATGALGSLSLADSTRRLTETAFRSLPKKPKRAELQG